MDLGRAAGAVGPGLVACGLGALAAWAVSAAVPAIPLLTAAVALGFVAAQLPPARRALDGALAPGVAASGRRLLRAGIALLGLGLSLGDLAALGWWGLAAIVAAVALSFAGVYGIARLFRLPGDEPLLLASGYSICGVSAIGAVAGARGSAPREQAVPVALVTLCGTLAIAVLPPLALALGLGPAQFGRWVGAGVHDVGQVVATAGIAGPVALSVAVVVKLARVLLLAPLAAGVALAARRAPAGGPRARRPPLVPLFILLFAAAVLLRTLVPLPDWLLASADAARTALMAMALVALGSAIRLDTLGRSGWRAAAAGLLGWALVAAVALPIALLPPAGG